MPWDKGAGARLPPGAQDTSPGRYMQVLRFGGPCSLLGVGFEQGILDVRLHLKGAVSDLNRGAQLAPPFNNSLLIWSMKIGLVSVAYQTLLGSGRH